MGMDSLYDCSSYSSWLRLLQAASIGSTPSTGLSALDLAIEGGKIVSSLMTELRSPSTSMPPGMVAANLQTSFALRKWRRPLENAGAYSERSLTQDAIQGFRLRNKQAMSGLDGGLPRETIRRVAWLLARWLPPSSTEWLVPKLGPGQVRERYSYLEKRLRLSRTAPSWWGDLFALCLPSHTIPGWVGWCPHIHDCGTPRAVPGPRAFDQDGRTCRLAAVPKTWKAQRLITVEPFDLGLRQQAVREYILACISRGPLGKDPYWGSFLEQAQGVQRKRALLASSTGVDCTLDLSAASDGIDWETVQVVFPDHLVRLLRWSRSTHFECEGAREELYIYAGMGNATTFMVETLFFQAVITALCSQAGIPGTITTFGDDIVAPSKLMGVIPHEGYGRHLRINADKSFWTGCFRESCGIYAYKGVDVTPLLVRGPYVGDAISRVGLCDLFKRVQERTVSGSKPQRLLARRIMRRVPWNQYLDPFPTVPDGAVGYRSADARQYGRRSLRWNDKYQRVEAWLPCVRTRTSPFYVEGQLGVDLATCGALFPDSDDVSDRYGRYSIPRDAVRDSRWMPI
jgi:hypothetical protein